MWRMVGMRTRFSEDVARPSFVLLAMVAGFLMLAVPATVVFAQTIAIDGDDIQYNGICQNIIGSIGDISAGNGAVVNSQANANASAGGGSTTGSDATADANSVVEIAQESGVSIEQVNECLNGAGIPTNGTTNDTTGGDTTAATTASTLSAAEESTMKAEVIVASIPEQKVLANTGGLPLLTWSAITLAVAVVIGARVIGRR
jgi:hypothetical protein